MGIRDLSLSLYIYIIISVYESFKKWVYNICIHNIKLLIVIF